MRIIVRSCSRFASRALSPAHPIIVAAIVAATTSRPIISIPPSFECFRDGRTMYGQRPCAAIGHCVLRRPAAAHTMAFCTFSIRERSPAMPNVNNPFGSESKLSSKAGDVTIYSLKRLGQLGLGDLDRLPFSIKVLLESCLRNMDNFQVNEDDVKRVAAWNPSKYVPAEVPFKPARVILQDFTGVPCVVDLASMRGAMKRAGGDPQ